MDEQTMQPYGVYIKTDDARLTPLEAQKSTKMQARQDMQCALNLPGGGYVSSNCHPGRWRA